MRRSTPLNEQFLRHFNSNTQIDDMSHLGENAGYRMTCLRRNKEET